MKYYRSVIFSIDEAGIDGEYYRSGMKTVINDSDHFGKALRRARKSQGLTQQQLALTANTAPRFISELERGKRTCQVGKALHVARCLGLRVTVEDVER